jgi:hypothetical protein
MPAKHLPGRILDIEKINTPKGLKFPTDLGPSIWLYAGNLTRLRIMRALQQRGYPVIWETDDNYTLPDDAGLSDWLKWTNGTQKHSYDLATKGAEIADAVIVSTDELANVYSKHNKNIFVCRNCVDPKDWSKPKFKNDGILRVGWSASSSHLKDMELLAPLVEWLRDRRDVQFTVFGSLSKHFPDWVQKKPWVDSLGKYRKSLRGMDVMLCPVKRHPFTDCRSDLKALEAVMSGACVAVPDSPVFSEWQDKAHICRDARGWKLLVQHLVSHRDEIPLLKERHRSYVMTERTITAGISQWERAIAQTG